jgi:hypothetical protein
MTVGTAPAPADSLVRRLIEAAASAIANRQHDLAYKPEQIRGLMVELELANGGQVVDVTAHVTRKYVHRYQREPAEPIERGAPVNNRILGTVAMLGAPALLIEQLMLRGAQDARVTGIASMVFMAGWICSNTGLRRLRAAGTRPWGSAVLLVQLVGLGLAFLFGLFEATGLFGADTLVFALTDAAWPLSMLWMVVVGVSVLVAKRLHGWRRVVPVLCPLWLPVAMASGAAFGDLGGLVGTGLAAVLWALLGYVVRDSCEHV